MLPPLQVALAPLGAVKVKVIIIGHRNTHHCSYDLQHVQFFESYRRIFMARRFNQIRRYIDPNDSSFSVQMNDFCALAVRGTDLNSVGV